MEIITEQIRQTIVKEIAGETLNKCIEGIDKEINAGKLHPYPLFQHHRDGLTMAKNIIREIALDRFGIILKIKLK